MRTSVIENGWLFNVRECQQKNVTYEFFYFNDRKGRKMICGYYVSDKINEKESNGRHSVA